jgi:GTPase involved in cell partitioning and DNA repair
MTKKILLIALLSLALFACNDDKKQEKALLNEVIKVHDKVMTDDGVVMKNKMKLDAIASLDKTPATKDSVAVYKKLLSNADDTMMDWMNKFNADYTGKSHTEIMDYLNAQKQQVLKIQAQLDTAIAQSNRYLIKNKQK